MKHTPGPWTVNGRSIDSIDRRIVATTEGIYRRERARPAEQEANARLIAAAPELLTFVRTVLDHHDEDPIIDLKSDARALLARIEGE